jgi:hypothetical protein
LFFVFFITLTRQIKVTLTGNYLIIHRNRSAEALALADRQSLSNAKLRLAVKAFASTLHSFFYKANYFWICQ